MFCYFAHVSLSVSGLVFVLHSLHASPSTRRRGSSIAGKSIHVQTTSASQASIPTWLPFLGMSLCAAAFIIIVNAITNGICEGGTSSPSCPPAVPPQHTFFVILVGILLTFGLGGLLGATNQSMALPSSMLVQMAWGGLLLPGNIIANVIVAAINNAVVAQSLSLLSDYRVGILLKISPRVMFVTQLLGTGVGVLSSTLSCVRPPLPALTNCDIWVRYQMVIGFSRSGTIVLNQGLWPNVGAGATNSTVSLFVVYGFPFCRFPHFLLVAPSRHVHCNDFSHNAAPFIPPRPCPALTSPSRPPQCSQLCSPNTACPVYSKPTLALASPGASLCDIFPHCIIVTFCTGTCVWQSASPSPSSEGASPSAPFSAAAPTG